MNGNHILLWRTLTIFAIMWRAIACMKAVGSRVAETRPVC
jgi:hypothetical protein